MSGFDWDAGKEQQKKGLDAGYQKVKQFVGQDTKKVIPQLQELFQRAEKAQKNAEFKSDDYYYWLGYKNAIREGLSAARGKR